MASGRMLAVALVVLGAAVASAAEMAGVPGSAVQYPTAVEAGVAGRPVKLVLTGVALRQKLFLSVYAIGSYVQEGVKVHWAEQLAAADCAKRLHLVMERTVEGKDMAEAFRAAVRMNYPEPAFAGEVARLTQFMRNDTARKGDHIYLTQVPGVGLHCSLAGKAEFLIENVHFARAVWEIYLGKNNLGEGIKKGLVSRL